MPVALFTHELQHQSFHALVLPGLVNGGSLETPGTMTLHQVAPLEDRQPRLLQAPQPFALAQTSVDQ